MPCKARHDGILGRLDAKERICYNEVAIRQFRAFPRENLLEELLLISIFYERVWKP
ncbi:hypothetical protein SELSPUOL_01957 [Selenomonas sputigena ATCC 35185]|uniref:Uncharacterized protein n=1 Tax=Selenomonas sputigena (strain ATCC 35185 / DSM 20758 / CCUG 44933 / VPI D19B-28) TaxID=546271 RepID=C9LWV2_SELS3|nr:hypothetical protein SELSPUOL_01957 [Selenomonas sputigena ATCC 35185]